MLSGRFLPGDLVEGLRRLETSLSSCNRCLGIIDDNSVVGYKGEGTFELELNKSVQQPH
jgi:hypothetical protein